MAQVNRLYGLDRPLLVQYGRFVDNAAHLDFGTSICTQRAVSAEIRQRFPATVELSLAALIVAVGAGIPLGYAAARRHQTWFDTTSVVLSLLGISIPVFFLAYLLKYVFAVKLGWLPSVGRQDPALIAPHRLLRPRRPRHRQPGRDRRRAAPPHPAGPGARVNPLAIITRITRASVLEVTGEDYIRRAEAKGLVPRQATFARFTISRSRWSWACRLRQRCSA